MGELCDALEEGDEGVLTLTPVALPTPNRRSVTGVVFARRRRVALADVVAFVFVVPVPAPVTEIVVDSFPFAFVFVLDPAVGLKSTFWSC